MSLLLISETNIKRDIDLLATLTDQTKPGYTRRPFTKEYTASRNWLKKQMEEVGLTVTVDAAANLIGYRKGNNPNLLPIMLGSHTDSVVGGGRFDGIIGVLGAIEIVRQLNKLDIILEHPLLVVDFTAEEASEFGISTIGSRGMVGALTNEQLGRINDDKITLKEGLIYQGGTPEDLYKKARQKNSIALYLELHIEQGPILDKTQNDLGAVTGIVGIERYQLVVTGQANHAGTTPMNMRVDALTTAADLILTIEKIANKSYEEAVVGTVGRIHSVPNASNVVPGKVMLEFELRSINKDALKEMVKGIQDHAIKMSEKQNIEIKMEKLSSSNPVKVDADILEGIYKSCKQVGKTIKLPSGAGHDANQLATIAPIGMIFVPSKDGKSHCPEEWTDYSQVAKGVQALANAVLYFDEYYSTKNS